MKIIPKVRINSVSALERMNNEIRILSILNHSTIPRFIEVLHSNTYLWVITEHGGESLQSWWKSQNERITIPTLKSIFKQILESILYLNSLFIAHRDIKMSNILIQFPQQQLLSTETSALPKLVNSDITPPIVNIRLCDFGFACDKFNRDQTDDMTTDFCGSPGFFAPELILSERWNALPTDIWSVGCLFLQFLLGDTQFQELWITQYKLDLFHNAEPFEDSIRTGMVRIRGKLSQLPLHIHGLMSGSRPTFTQLMIEDFLWMMLCMDPAERSTPTDCLECNFLSDNADMQPGSYRSLQGLEIGADSVSNSTTSHLHPTTSSHGSFKSKQHHDSFISKIMVPIQSPDTSSHSIQSLNSPTVPAKTKSFNSVSSFRLRHVVDRNEFNGNKVVDINQNSSLFD